MDDVRAYEPVPRWGHTSVIIGDKVYVWGGRVDDFSETNRKELGSLVEVFSLPDQCWEQKKTKGKPPLGLYNNASTAIGEDLYVYGGWDGHAAHNSLHQLRVPTLTWKEMGSGDVDELPMKMSGCGLVAFGSERLVLFGGYGLPSTTKVSSKPAGKKVNLVTTSRVQSSQSTQSSVEEGEVKLLGVKLNGKMVNGNSMTNEDLLSSGDCGGSNVLVNEAATEEMKEEAKEDLKEKMEKEEEEEDDDEGDEEEEEEEQPAEVSALIDKRWTNELKVYDLQNGAWSSPEVSGDCPPPCVDFSFDCLDGRMAVLFGGYRPESGASSGAYLLDMELWHWTKLGDYETTKGRLQWPVARDGHASCVLSEVPHPQILISGGWDKDNNLLNDGWILDVQRRLWKRFAIPDSVGPRFWHRLVSYKYSPTLRQLVFFGGCPGAPTNAATGGSWEKLASTILVEMGLVKRPVDHHDSQRHPSSSIRSASNRSEWVVVDSLTLGLMGDETRRMKERLLIAECRALQAEVQAQRAEKIAKDVLHKLETALSRLGEGMTLPVSNSISPYNSDTPVSASTSQEKMGEKTGEKQPFWMISHSDITLTAEELGKGRWGVVKVANHKGKRVAARCLYSQITSRENRKVFIEGLDIAAKMRHPNILPLIGAILEGEPVIVTNLMASNLRKVLDAGKLYNYQVATLALDVAEGLLFLHTTRPDPVVHGDLPATSVLVYREDGNLWHAKLSDYMTAKFFRSVIMASASDLDSEAGFSPNYDQPVFFPPRSTTPRTTPPPLMMSHRNKRFSGSDASINKRVSGRKQSHTAPDVLETATLTPQRDVYSYGLLLVELCTGTTPVEVSFQFLTESITWSEISSMVKLCTEYIPSNRPDMETLVKKIKQIHRTATSRPSKFSMTAAT